MKPLARCALSLIASLLFIVPAVAVAQESRPTPAQCFEQARLVEESQRDFARALELYALVAADAAAPKELVAKAWLRCGRMHQRLGRDADAKQAFEKAAALEGEAAQEAKRILSGVDDDAERVAERVKKLIGQFSKISPPGKDERRNLQGISAFVDLVWIGDAAVPLLAAELEAAFRDDSQGGPILTMALIDIGSEKAAKVLRQALARTDPIYLRGVLVWLPDVKNLAAEPVRTELLALTRQPDPRIRRFALEQLKRVMTLDEVLALTRDEDAEVRALAIGTVPAMFSKDTADRLAGYSGPVLDALDATLRDSSPIVRRSACSLFAMSPPPILANPRGRELFLDTLGRDEMFEEAVGAWNDQAPDLWDSRFVPPLPAAKLLDVAHKLAPFPTFPLPKNRRQLKLSTLVIRSWQSGTHGGDSVEAWSREERPLLWEMLRLGLRDTLSGWIVKFADAGDAVAIAEALASNGTLSGCEGFFIRVVPALSRTDRERLFESFQTILVATHSRLAAADNEGGELNSVAQCATMLATLGLEEADRRLVLLAQEVPQLLGHVMQELIKRETTTPVTSAVLADLLVLEGDRARVGDPKTWRNQLVKILADRRATELLPRFARAYELGLEPITIPHFSQSIGGVRLALFKPRDNSELFDPRYSREQFLPVFEACARGNKGAFWQDAWSIIGYAGTANPPDAYLDDLARVIGRHVADCTTPSMRKGIVKDYVTRACAGWQEFVAGHLEDPELGDTILEALPSLPHDLAPRLIEKVKAMLPALSPNAAKNVVARLASSEEDGVQAALLALRDHPDEKVRYQFAFSLLAVWGDRAVELVLPLAKDPDESVRYAVASGLGRSFDRRAIPTLIELLRDSDLKTRSKAKESLDQLQFYFDQKERWTRLLEGAGLDATTAAEALLKQTAATQPKATRLAAIESLGTLGVAETLPMLVQFLGDGDAEIEAAAMAAVGRINRRAAERDSAPPARSDGKDGKAEKKSGE